MELTSSLQSVGPHVVIGLLRNELVTLSCNPLIKSPEISCAGKHLSAVEFHLVLQRAVQVDKDSQEGNGEIVLLDARNLYETRIGKFHIPNVETLDPSIRQYSDLPSWIDDNCDQLQGKSVLMYCTGGIRCEMASAYIRSKGAGFENVFQLYGGIQRYLEQFPDGGFFRGKNFVFDHRISVGSSDSNILGACLLCGTSYDDYSSRIRCNHCRMLVLVCGSFQQRKDSFYVCELCQNHHKGVGLKSSVENGGSCSLPSVETVTALSSHVRCLADRVSYWDSKEVENLVLTWISSECFKFQRKNRLVGQETRKHCRACLCGRTS